MSFSPRSRQELVVRPVESQNYSVTGVISDECGTLDVDRRTVCICIDNAIGLPRESSRKVRSRLARDGDLFTRIRNISSGDYAVCHHRPVVVFERGAVSVSGCDLSFRDVGLNFAKSATQAYHDTDSGTRATAASARTS